MVDLRSHGKRCVQYRKRDLTKTRAIRILILVLTGIKETVGPFDMIYIAKKCRKNSAEAPHSDSCHVINGGKQVRYMQKTYKLTAERLRALQEELNYLRTVREKEVAEQIKEARSFGDLSENSEYDEAKNEQGRIFSRMAELEAIISHAKIIEPEKTFDRVAAGCRVVVLDLDAGEEETYSVVGSQEANPLEARVSDESPFGLALVGKQVGDELCVNVPAGTLRYRIVNILL